MRPVPLRLGGGGRKGEAKFELKLVLKRNYTQNNNNRSFILTQKGLKKSSEYLRPCLSPEDWY